MKSAHIKDWGAAIGFIAIALTILFLAIPYGVQEPKKVKFVALSPSYYPRLVCYCLLGFGLALLARQFFHQSKADKNGNTPGQKIENQETDNQTIDSPAIESQPIKRVYLLAIAGLLFAYYLTLPTLGFVLSSTIVLLLLLLLAGDRNPVALVVIPLLLPICVYLFFTKVANIPIPAGVLEPWLIGD